VVGRHLHRGQPDAHGRAHISANQSVPSDGATHTVQFDTKGTDPGQNIDTTGYYYEIPRSGYYRVSASLGWEVSADSPFQIEMYLREFSAGSTFKQDLEAVNSNNGHFTRGRTVQHFSKGDQIGVIVRQDSGNSKDVSSTDSRTMLEVAPVR